MFTEKYVGHRILKIGQDLCYNLRGLFLLGHCVQQQHWLSVDGAINSHLVDVV